MNSIDPLKDGNIKNKMGIIGYTERRQRFYKYNPETPTVVHPSLAPIPVGDRRPEIIPIKITAQQQPTITKPLQRQRQQQQRPKPQQPTTPKPNKSNKGAGIIAGAILLLLIIIMIVAHAINLHYNMQDVKYFQDKVDLQQQIIDNLQPVNFLYHYYYYVSNNVLLILHSEEVSN